VCAGVGECVLADQRVWQGCVLREKVGGKGAGKRRQAVCPVPECGKAVEETVCSCIPCL
jgi:hypothetical protein